ncbi:MAG TPA: stage III sporulation protein D [Acholeplasmataceae bacterium]|jgi:putative DeoR family transcriptional regulator (stage III sporulation protein D)|nr:stage III sporulation protein D [Acholeplasmataceae bacterium]
MDNEIKTRVLTSSHIFLKKASTVREVAKIMGCSKSTVHKDFTERLPKIDPGLYEKVKELLNFNKQIRHIRGGEATRRKYELEKI